MRVILFLLLILAAPFALADSAGIGSLLPSGAGSTGGSIFTIPNMDQSVIFLSEIFGQVGSVLGGATNGPLQQAILLFNNIALVMGGFVILYAIIVSTMNTAHDGEMLGKKWSSVWIPLRAAGGFSLLLPVKVGGYAFCQVFVMWVVLQGIGAADYVWGTYLKNVKQGNAAPQVPYVSSTVMPAIASIFQNAACTIALSNTINTVETAVPGMQSDTPVISYPTAISPVASSINFTTSLLANKWPTACGSIALQAVPSVAKPTGQGLNSLQTANQQGNSGIFGNMNQNQQKKSAIGVITQTFQNSMTDTYQAQRASHANQVLINITQLLNQAAVFYVQKSNYCNNNTDRSCINDVQRQITNAALSYVSQTSGASSPAAARNRGEFSNASRAIMQDLSMAQQYGWLYAGSYYILLSKITGATSTENVSAPTVTTIYDNMQAITNLSSTSSGFLQSPESQYVKQITAICLHTGSAVNSTAVVSDSGTVSKGAGPAFVPCIPPELNTSGPAATLNIAFVGVNGTNKGPLSATIGAVNGIFGDILNGFIQVLTGVGGNPVISLSFFGQTTVVLVLGAFAILTAAITLLSLTVGLVPFSPGTAMDSAISVFVQLVILPIMGALGLAIGVGALAGYYLPLVPYILFTAGSLAWFILVIEAMIAAPIVALGIVHPEGQHDIWGRGEKGIMIIVSIFLRPALMVVGFIAASLLVYIAFQILNSGYLVAVAFIGSTGGSLVMSIGMGMITLIFTLVTYIALATFLMHQCFKLIHKIPDNIMRWLGEAAEQTGQEADQEVSSGGQKVSGGAEGAAKAGAEASKQRISEAQNAAAVKKGLEGAIRGEKNANEAEQKNRKL